jgi:hypothetical protein
MRSKVLLTLAMISAACLTARAQAPAAGDSSSSTATPAQTTTPAATPTPTPAATPAPAATPDATPAAATPAAAPTWSVGPIDFSGEVSGYYTYNANHPHNQGFNSSDGGNNLYNFNSQSNSMDLSFAKIAMSHSPDPVGFELDFGFGRTIQTINLGEQQQPGGFQYVEQAYVEWKPAKAKGFEIDFGKFSTSAGAEVIEDYSNWNYSHSLLFSWAIPYYHFGVRTSFPVGKHFTGGVQVVNGWNDVTDNNTGKTIGLTGALAYAKWTLNLNYYTGPENFGTNKGFRNLFDTTLLLTPPGKINAYINFDYGNNGNSTCCAPATKASASWYGLATAVHIQVTPKWALTPRIEWFDDAEGYTLSGALPSPIWDLGGAVAQQVKEATVTLEYKLLEGLLWRLEYRRDWSTYPMFERGLAPIGADECNYAADDCEGTLMFNNPAGLKGYSKSQNTVTIAVIAFFGPKR